MMCRLRAVDLDDAAPGHAADAERQVDRHRAGRQDALGEKALVVAEAHDGALAELLLDLRQRALQAFAPLYLLCHRSSSVR
jgi:hypothetical protein